MCSHFFDKESLLEKENREAIYREGPLIALSKVRRVRLDDEGVHIDIDFLEILEGDLEFPMKSVTLFSSSDAIGISDFSLYGSYVGWELLFSDILVEEFRAFCDALPATYTTQQRFRTASEYLISWRNRQRGNQ
jgi:hypothetical protein